MYKNKIKKISLCAVFGAMGFVLMLLEFPLPFIIPSFVKFDFSEIPAIIAAFAYGPLYGILVCAVKNALHLFVTTSAGVGELSNFIMGAIFVGAAGIIYKFNHTRKGALVGSLVGATVMAVISVFTNYFVVYPAFVVLYGLPLEAIIGMYKDLLPFADSLFKALVIFNLPFNLFKGIIDAAICFAIYKRISPLLKKLGSKVE
ncbi:MAG: ECF transporter S component [Clostridia bacterium]|nr:ECF transporter S component [Clostridia bacterium]